MDNLDGFVLPHLRCQEEFYKSIVNGNIVNDHFKSLEDGLKFLDKLSSVSTNEQLRTKVKYVMATVKSTIVNQPYRRNDGSLTRNLNLAYTKLREMMMNHLMEQKADEYGPIFPHISLYFKSLEETNDFLLEKIKKLVTINLKADEVAPLIEVLGKLEKMLKYLKPLLIYVAIFPKSYLKLEDNKLLTPLTNFLGKATWFVYLSLVGIMDEDFVFDLTDKLSKLVMETDIGKIYHSALSTSASKILVSGTRYMESEFKLLENLIRLSARVPKSLSRENSRLYEELIRLRYFLSDVEENTRLKKLHYLEASIEAVFPKLIPVIYTCFSEETDDKMAKEVSVSLSDGLLEIQNIKSGVSEINLCCYPKTDTVGFLTFFLGYLKELWKCQKIPICKNEIHTLYSEACLLLNFLRRTTINVIQAIRTQIVKFSGLAYQAEYLIDHYLVNNSKLRLISSLSSIVSQMKLIRTKVLATYPIDATEDEDDLKYHISSTVPLGVNNVHHMIVEAQDDVVRTRSHASNIVVGLEKHINVIEGYLFCGDKDLDVISIVGMPGLGKTTLASYIFNTPSVARHFDVQVWCTVSQNYQTREVLLNIINQVNIFGDDIRLGDDPMIADQLYKCLKKRRYLIVMDDIWDTDLWKFLKRYLPDDKKGSRLLITTRNATISSEIKSKTHHLCLLTDDESWKLFQNRLPGTECLPKHLIKIGKEIAVNCKGLPLSIVVAAGLFADENTTERQWNFFSRSVNSLILEDAQSNCKEILKLSYDHLPNYLQLCFLYLGVFPEGQEISVSILTRLWIAEGFVQDCETKSLEDIAGEYVVELIHRNLLIALEVRSLGPIKACRLHDLLHDFCLQRAKDEHFLMVLDHKRCSRPFPDPRRLSINFSMNTSDNTRFSCHSIRSILFFSGLEGSEIDQMIKKYEMVLLKVLHVSDIKCAPEFLSDLIHLRYLAIGASCSNDFHPWSIFSSVSKNQNLQFLIIETTKGVVKVPDCIWDMEKLRHVKLLPRALFHLDTNRLQNLNNISENLSYLSKPKVCHGDIIWLKKLPGLRRLSCLFSQDVPLLSFFSQLTSLTIECEASSDSLKRHKLQLPPSLEQLNLKRLILCSEDISEIGRTVPGLLVLKLNYCNKPNPNYVVPWEVEDIDFPRLKVLKLRNVGFNHWSASEYSFPYLEELWLENCNDFESIPPDLGDIPNLRFVSIRNCRKSLEESAKKLKRYSIIV